MPVLDGIAATQKIKTLFPYEPIRIVALTAHYTEREKIKCYQAGMLKIFAKPLQPTKLKKILNL